MGGRGGGGKWKMFSERYWHIVLSYFIIWIDVSEVFFISEYPLSDGGGGDQIFKVNHSKQRVITSVLGGGKFPNLSVSAPVDTYFLSAFIFFLTKTMFTNHCWEEIGKVLLQEISKYNLYILQILNISGLKFDKLCSFTLINIQ